MGTIDPKLNDYTWENFTSLKSIFSKKTYKILSRFKRKKERRSFNDTLEAVIEVDNGLLIKLKNKFKMIDRMTMAEVIEALKISAYESFFDKKIYIDKALEFIHSSKKKDDKYAALLANLAYIYFSMGEYDNALSLHKKSLAIREKILGLESLDTANSYNSIAELYQAQGDYIKALPLYKKSLAIREKKLDEEHPDTATSYNNLAILYKLQGDYVKALSLYQKALSIREKILGEEHPDTTASYNNLAGLYKAQDDYTQALPLYEKALSIREKILGEEHPKTVASYNNLAELYRSQGNYAQALPLHQKALAIREKIFGVKHLDTATSYNNLAILYHLQGDHIQALLLYQKALAINSKMLGAEHPDIASSYNNLAVLYKSQGDYVEALPLHQKALEIRSKILGLEHPDTASSYSNLAGLYEVQGDDLLALKLYQKALAIRDKTLGEEHFDTALSYNNLAKTYHSQGNHAQALPLYEKALAIFEKSSGELDPNTIKIHENINNLKQKQNKAFFLNSNNSNLIFKIDSAKIECFKQYQNFSIDFSPRINIIIGQNAIGKTTLLQAITLGLLKENSPDEEKTYTKYIRKNKEKSKLTLSHNDHKKIIHILREKRKIENNHFIPFVLSYGSNFFTKYDISTDKIVDNILNETINKNFSHSIFLDHIDKFWNPLTILRELFRSKHEKAIEKKNFLFNTINIFLELENYKLEEKNEKFFFLKEGDDTPLFLEELSEGYRGNVLLITDMLVKILGVGWTPATIEGIILIDEFDKHLHPTWQSQLVAKLADTFPNIQFIMTTHNPMSILDREPDEITIIKEKDGEIIAVRGNGTKTIDVSTVLLEYFDVKSTISESMQQKINRFNRLKLQKERTKNEEKELKNIEGFLGNTVASNFIYDRKYLKFLEYIQTHKNIDFDKYETVDDKKMDELLNDFGDFFND